MESLFTSCDYLPWTDSATVDLLDRKFACSFDKQNFEVLYPLMKALVTSRRPEDIQRGIELIQGSLPFTTDPMKKKKETYLLAVGYFRSGDYPKSKTLVETCLEIKPNCWKALSLKEVLVRKDRVITVLDVAATTFGVLSDVLAGMAAASRSSSARWGIEDVPARRHSVPKKSTEDVIDKDVIGICTAVAVVATGAAFGMALALVLCRSK